MEIRKCLLTHNDCYLTGKKIVPKGIVVHSTGCNAPFLKRFLQPDDGVLGVNVNNNDWNRGGIVKNGWEIGVQDITIAAMEEGYDGVIFRNIDDAGYEELAGTTHTTLAVFFLLKSSLPPTM